MVGQSVGRRSAAAARPTHARPRVVLVSGYRLFREVLTLFLEDAGGVEVIAAVEDRARGHQAVLEHRPDFALIDDPLPDGRGIELAGVLHHQTPEVGVIILCAAISEQDMALARRNGALEVMPNTVRGEALLEVLFSHMGGHPGPAP